MGEISVAHLSPCVCPVLLPGGSMRRPTVPAVLAACAAAVIAWTGAAGAATAAPTSSAAAPTGATVTAPAKPAAKTTTATYSHACSTAVAKGFAHCDALIRTDVAREGRPAERAARRLRPGRPAERVQAAGSTGRRRPDRRDRRRLRRPERRGRPGHLPPQYGLPPCTTANGCFRKVNQNGGTQPTRAPTPAGPARSRSTSTWSRRSARSCHILLVEAELAPACANLGTAVNHGRRAGREVRLQQLRRRRVSRATPATTPRTSTTRASPITVELR